MTQTLVAALRAAIDTALEDLVDVSRPVALLDYPDHGNPGDAAIWLGTTRWLAEHGVDVLYVSDYLTFDQRALKRRLGRGTILFHGGGNVGALYPEHEHFRQQVIEAFPDHPIGLLPQTLELTAPDVVNDAARFLARHPKVWALGRDAPSTEILRAHMGDRARLCPDMALTLTPSLPRREAEFDVVTISRSDRESAVQSAMHAAPGEYVTDWITSRVHRRDLRLRMRIATRATNRSSRLTSVLPYDLNARFVMREGLDVLSRGRVVISDRLHVHILCTLLGKPHVSLDNRYGKLRAFRDTWTHDADVSVWASDPADAREKALALLDRT